MSEAGEMLDRALGYAATGFYVFPLHTPDAEGRCSCHKPDCHSAGKHPRTMAGLRDATRDEERIRHWWGMWPEANIGVLTGGEAGIVVVDVDPRHGGEQTLKELADARGGIPEKALVRTGGGGWHLYFRHPGFYVKSRAGALGAGVDVKGEGGYVVAPPSLHASGKSYEWRGVCDSLPELPAWLREMLAADNQPSRRMFTSAETGGADTEGEPLADGSRNVALTSMAGSMRRRGFGEEAIYSALAVENAQRCAPPLEEGEVRSIARSVARYEPSAPPALERPRHADAAEPASTPDTDAASAAPSGIFRVSDLAPEVDELFEQGRSRGVSTGWARLDYHYTVKLGQWTVITGMPSMGKSSVLSALMVNLANLHGWRFAVCSPENQPLAEYVAELISIKAGEPFDRGYTARMTRETMQAARRWLDEHFVFVLPPEGDCTVRGILERVIHIYDEREIQGVVIDPWNELEHRRPAVLSETEYVSQSLTQMRRFARDFNVHLWLVAHPTKMVKVVQRDGQVTYPVPTLYDISGSANFRNKCDMGLVVWRDLQDQYSPTQVHIQKVRFRWCGQLGQCDLFYDVRCGRYTEEGEGAYASGENAIATLDRYERENGQIPFSGEGGDGT